MTCQRRSGRLALFLLLNLSKKIYTFSELPLLELAMLLFYLTCIINIDIYIYVNNVETKGSVLYIFLWEGIKTTFRALRVYDTGNRT